MLALALALLAGTAAMPADPPKLLTWPDLTARPRPKADATLAYGSAPEQKVDLWRPAGPGPHPVVLMVHGGCWQTEIADRTLMDWIAADLRESGVAVWNIDYRGVDRPGGGYPGTFTDAAAAADLLAVHAGRYGLDTRRVVAVGHSAGGHLALWLAGRARLPEGSPLRTARPLPIARVVSLGGLPDLEATAAAEDNGCGTEVVGQLVGTRPDPYADTSVPRLLPLGVAQDLVNGREDRIIPHRLATDYIAKARAAGDRVTLHTVPNTGHVELIAPETAAWAEAKRIVLAALKPSQTRPGRGTMQSMMEEPTRRRRSSAAPLHHSARAERSPSPSKLGEDLKCRTSATASSSPPTRSTSTAIRSARCPARRLPRSRTPRRTQWGERLIRSWNEGWIDAPTRIGAKLAPLLGARPHEVIVGESTSTTLYKALVAALRLDPARRTIVTEAGNFHTDLHIAEGAVAAVEGATLAVLPRDAVEAALDDRTAVLMLTHVHYKTAERFDMAALTAAAHAAGALMLWDLSHSAGAVPLDLDGAGVDLAVGCGYKYLNGGPGAPAFLYVAQALQHRLDNPLSGWMGHAEPFAFEDGYRPAAGMKRWLTGTPPILGLAALEVGVDLWAEADIDAAWTKACELWTILADAGTAAGLECVTPAEPERRGSHVSFRHPHAHAIVQALIARGVIGDFRAPDIARFGITPLYLDHDDVARAGAMLAEVMASEAYRAPEFQQRLAVT